MTIVFFFWTEGYHQLIYWLKPTPSDGCLEFSHELVTCLEHFIPFACKVKGFQCALSIKMVEGFHQFAPQINFQIGFSFSVRSSRASITFSVNFTEYLFTGLVNILASCCLT